MKTTSWVILVIVGALMLLGSLASLGRAYISAEDQIGAASLAELSAGRPELATAVRARRATAAAYAAGFATLFLAITLGPYRRGDVWAWWALLASTLIVSLLILLRIPFLGTRLGAAAAVIQVVVVGLGLALDAGRLRGSSAPPA
jgi:hypothetical protein